MPWLYRPAGTSSRETRREERLPSCEGLENPRSTEGAAAVKLRYQIIDSPRGRSSRPFQAVTPGCPLSRVGETRLTCARGDGWRPAANRSSATEAGDA